MAKISPIYNSGLTLDPGNYGPKTGYSNETTKRVKNILAYG